MNVAARTCFQRVVPLHVSGITRSDSTAAYRTGRSSRVITETDPLIPVYDADFRLQVALVKNKKQKTCQILRGPYKRPAFSLLGEFS